MIDTWTIFRFLNGRTLRRAQKLVGTMLALSVLSGCASTYAEREVNYTPTEVNKPNSDIAENELLGVRISTFDPGDLPTSGVPVRGLSPEIRKAEGYYIAVQLKNTMQGSGYWGPVRVVPADSGDGEVIVKGEILESDGEILKLRVDVQDASGAKWFSKEYGGVVNTEIYEQTKLVGIDAFQYLYNQIANDIAQHKQKFAAERVTKIRQIAEVRFAADFAPDVFSGYLKNEGAQKEEQKEPDVFSDLLTFASSDDTPSEEKPQYELVRLPSEDDPMYQRVKRIRAREHLLIDTLDQQYEGLAKDIADSYVLWRVSRLNEMNAIREVERQRNERVTKALAVGLAAAIIGGALGSRGGCVGCAAAGAVVASVAVQKAMEASEQAEGDTNLRMANLEERGQSLAAEVKPVVLKVEGETVELKGTVEAKFQQWREVMKKLHDREVGPLENAPTARDAKADAAGS